MKILYISYGFKENDVSETASARNLIERMRHLVDLTVITKDDTREPDVINVKCNRAFEKHSLYRAIKPDYVEFIIKAYTLARKISHRYDIIHHISPVSVRYPNILGMLGKPFVWGPVGGSVPYPKGFEDSARRENVIKKLSVVDQLRLKFDPLLLLTMENAARILVTSSTARRLLPKKYQSRCQVFPEGINLDEMTELAPNRTHPLLQDQYIYSSGRLVPYKGMDLLIRAYARIENPAFKLFISGDGHERGRLEKLIVDLGLKERVVLLGHLDRALNLKFVNNSLFCVFPALKEAFGHVNLEAMALKKALIVSDNGGPADIVVQGLNGFKIPTHDTGQFIRDLSVKIQELYSDEGLRHEMGLGGYHLIARKYSWSLLAEEMYSIYGEIMDSRLRV